MRIADWKEEGCEFFDSLDSWAPEVVCFCAVGGGVVAGGFGEAEACEGADFGGFVGFETGGKVVSAALAREFDAIAARRVARFESVDEVAPVENGAELLRSAAHFLGQLANRNPLLVQTSSWQLATEGLARLVRDLDELRRVIVVDFSDPNQMTLDFEGKFFEPQISQISQIPKRKRRVA